MSGEPRDVDLLQELYSTGLLVGMLVDEELAKIGVPDELFSFLGWVTRLEPVTPGRLAAETGLPPTTIRDYIRRLIASGDDLECLCGCIVIVSAITPCRALDR